MYSAELSSSGLVAVRATAPPAIKRALGKVLSAWRALVEIRSEDFQIHAEPPATVLELLRRLATKIGEHFTEHPAQPAPELQRIYFDLLNLLGLAEEFGPHALCVIERQTLRGAGQQPTGGAKARNRSTLSIRNVVPARYLKPRLETARVVMAFSATLQPAHFYRELLGFSETTPWLDDHGLAITRHSVSCQLIRRLGLPCYFGVQLKGSFWHRLADETQPKPVTQLPELRTGGGLLPISPTSVSDSDFSAPE